MALRGLGEETGAGGIGDSDTLEFPRRELGAHPGLRGIRYACGLPDSRLHDAFTHDTRRFPRR